MKIFGIGLSKTGTTSLARALEVLGYRVKDCLGVSEYVHGDLYSSVDMQVLQTYDAFTDTPMPSFFRELDQELPGSKFILTVRQTDGWLASCKKQFNQKQAEKQSDAQNKLFVDLYGTPAFDVEKFLAGYDRFTEQVIDYFKDRPDDLLVLNVTAGQGWDELCAFLNKPVPDLPFPKSNVTQLTWLNLNELAKAVRHSSMALRKFEELGLAGHATRSTSGSMFSRGFLMLQLWLQRCQSRVAKQRTHTLIKKHLGKLNPQIPVISEENSSIPLHERDRWNHFWLIGIENGSAAGTVNINGAATVVNLALIQDGVPFLGVVYFPANDVIYCAAINKGAFKIDGGDEPQKISPTKSDDSRSPESIISSREAVVINGNAPNNAMASFAWKSCRAAQEGQYPENIFMDTKEWQTAAVNIFLKMTGFQLIDSETGQELKYNKEDWLNSSVYIKKL